MVTTTAIRQRDGHRATAWTIALLTLLIGMAAPPPRALAAVCGNGIVEEPETCDPPGGSCRANCTRCGDGRVNDPSEQCDYGAGNGSSYPACCSTTCTLRPYTCRLDDSNLCMGVVGVTSTPKYTDIPLANAKVARVRNKWRINTPFVVNDAKILFSSRFTFNPSSPGSGGDRGYSLDVFYDRHPDIHVQFVQSDYYVNSCTGGAARIGLQSGNSQIFPVISYPIDCGYAPQVAARSQVDISNKEIVMEFVRGSTFTTPLSGWGSCTTSHTGSPCAAGCPSDACGFSCDFVCTPSNLPAGTYQVWNATMSWDGITYPMTYVLPASGLFPEIWGLYADPRRLFNYRTEFFESGSFVQFLLWDMEVQLESSSTWVPVTEFKQGEPGGPSLHSIGARTTVFDNRPVLEISNDGSDTYHVLDDVFSIPATVSGVPSPKPRIEFTTAQQTVYNDQQNLKLTAKLDHTSASAVNVSLKLSGTSAATSFIQFPNPAIITIPAGSLTGSIQMNVSGTFPAETDNATIRMHRSCEGTIGTVPSEKIGFIQLPRRPIVSNKVDFGVPGPFSNYDVYVTVPTLPTADVSPLMQFAFEAGGLGKVGLRQAGGQKTADFVIQEISAAVASSPITAGCQHFSQTGVSGTSCNVAYNWVANREYRLRLVPLAANNRDWKATALDMETGAETEIGQIHLADAAPYTGYGGLRDTAQRPNGYVDWFASTTACGSHPAVKVNWRGPYASDGKYNPIRAEVVYTAGSCDQSNGSSTGCPRFTSDLGGTTARTVSEGTDVWAAAPCSSSTLTNDDFDAAKIVGALPWGDEVNTATATQASDDPTTSGTSCGASKHSASAWYKFTPATSQNYRVSAVGSGYDTIVGVWTGTRGSLTQVACNHDNANNAGGESELDFGGTAGTTYYIELAGYQTTGGGVGSVTVAPTSTCP